MEPRDIVIPSELRPSDGRFGSGPSKVRPEALAALHRSGSSYLGTSHRRGAVRSMIARLEEGLASLFSLPEDYEVVVGVGGATALWDAMAFGLIEHRSQHLVFGEFSAKCAEAVRAAPHLSDPEVIESDYGTHPIPRAGEDIDLYALTHNETSTGVAMEINRFTPRGLIAVDGVSAAGGLRVSANEFDFYYFSPQKGLAADAGIWVALSSPAAIERIESIGASDRYVPPFLDLKTALDNSRKDQTYNTPPLAAVFLMVEQIDWILDHGGLEWSASRCDRSAEILYGWAESSSVAEPFVKDPEQRSHVVGTVDFDASVDAQAVAAALRANEIVDTEPYRKLGRNQLRVGMYPAVEPDDVAALTRCIDYIVEAMS